MLAIAIASLILGAGVLIRAVIGSRRRGPHNKGRYLR